MDIIFLNDDGVEIDSDYDKFIRGGLETLETIRQEILHKLEGAIFDDNINNQVVVIVSNITDNKRSILLYGTEHFLKSASTILKEYLLDSRPRS